MYKHWLVYIILLTLTIACKSHKPVFIFPDVEETPSDILYVNDSVQKFHELESMIVTKAESETTYNNPITFYFKKHISKRALNEIEFKEWRQNIYLEFTVDTNHELLDVTTNSSSNKLDTQITKSFKKLYKKLSKQQEFNSKHKYTIVLIQNIDQKAVIKCNPKAIGYIPPIFKSCTHIQSYKALNKCNYLYLTDHLYNHVDLSLINDVDIENNHQIYPKLIVDKQGKVVAAKVESENKRFLESYYKAIMDIPNASQAAKFNEINEYYGYNFPTSITNIILNNEQFKTYYNHLKVDAINAKKMMKHYIAQLKYNQQIQAK